MSSESSGAEYFSSSEGVGLRESARSSDASSDPGSYFTASGELSSKESETEVHEIDDVAVSDLNTSDENQHGFDIKSGSSSSLKGTSQEDLSGITKSSGLTRKVSSQTGPLTKRASTPDSLKGLSTRRVSHVVPLEGLLTRGASSVDSLEEPSSKISLEDPLGGPSNSISPEDPLELSSTRISLEDLLEGTSSNTTWCGGQGGVSITSICRLSHSETEMTEPSNSETPTDQNGCCFRLLDWLCSSYRRYSRQIRLSKFYLLFHVALFIIPISAGYMGAKYQALCQGCPTLPGFVTAVGILLMCLLFIRVANMVSKIYLTPHLTGHEMAGWLLGLSITFCSFLFLLIVDTYTCNPVFLPRVATMKKFCYKDFYNYVYCLNICVPTIYLLMFLINLPGCFDEEGS